MVDHDAIEAEVKLRIREVQQRIDTQTEGHKRWNRLEEAMDTICEEAINLLDDVGRTEQATEISAMLAAHERFDAVLEIIKTDAKLATEAKAADREVAYARSRRLIESLATIASVEAQHRPF